MFVSIKFVNSVPNYENNTIRNSYVLVDTDFCMKLDTEIGMDAYNHRYEASVIPSVLIAVYRSKAKNVAKNLAMFYALSSNDTDTPMKEQYRLLECDFAWMQKYITESNCQQYKKCVYNQIQMLNYTGKAKYAQRVA